MLVGDCAEVQENNHVRESHELNEEYLNANRQSRQVIEEKFVWIAIEQMEVQHTKQCHLDNRSPNHHPHEVPALANFVTAHLQPSEHSNEADEHPSED